jgi:hypothetical protein
VDGEACFDEEATSLRRPPVWRSRVKPSFRVPAPGPQIAEREAYAMRAAVKEPPTVVDLMRRGWWICAAAGAPVSRDYLLELVHPDRGRAATVTDALEAGGFLVAVDSDHVRAAKPFRGQVDARAETVLG